MPELDFLHGSGPVPIILDTDLGNDVDDVLALALLHHLERRGECRLAAVTVNKANELAPAAVDLLNRFYGRTDLPVGWIGPQGPTPEDGKFLAELLRLGLPRNFADSQYPAAVPLLRQTLAAQPDHSVVIASIGFLSNLSALLESLADCISPLSGAELVRRKVRFLSIMAGNFSAAALSSPAQEFREYNIYNDIPAAERIFSGWPTPAVYCGFELGLRVLYPASSIEHDFATNHPAAVCYRAFAPMPHDRPCWDLIGALFAVRGANTAFAVNGPGRIRLFPDGYHDFTPDQRAQNYYLTASDQDCAEAADLFVELVRD